MRFISTRTHGILDYAVGLLLIAAPWLFGFADDTGATYVPVALGLAAIVYSLITDYELGVTKVISMPAHLTLDMLSGAFLAVSPWLFNFDERIWAPHVVLGLLEIAAALFTNRTPGKRLIDRPGEINEPARPVVKDTQKVGEKVYR